MPDLTQPCTPPEKRGLSGSGRNKITALSGFVTKHLLLSAERNGDAEPGPGQGGLSLP